MHAHDDEFAARAGKGSVELAHDVSGLLGRSAHNHAVRFHEVLNGRAFLEEFGVGDDLEIQLQPPHVQILLNDGGHAVGRAHGHGGLVHNDEVILHELSDLVGHLFDIVQIGGTILIRRSADADESYFRALEAFREIRGKEKTAIGVAALYHGGQTGLVNVHVSCVQPVNNVLLHINAGYRVAHFRKTGSADKPDVAGTDNAQFHD